MHGLPATARFFGMDTLDDFSMGVPLDLKMIF